MRETSLFKDVSSLKKSLKFFNGLVLICVFTKSWFQLGNPGIFSNDFSSFKKKSSGIAMQLTVTYTCLYSNKSLLWKKLNFYLKESVSTDDLFKCAYKLF